MKQVITSLFFVVSCIPAVAANSFAFDANGGLVHGGNIGGFSSERIQLLFLQAEGVPVNRVGSSCTAVSPRAFKCKIEGGNPAAMKVSEVTQTAFVDGVSGYLRVRHEPSSILIEVLQ
jgi:hypothetical protein